MTADRSVDLRRVDLNLLVAFDALVAERSVTAAAERLSVGQSAMSSTLGRLRRLLDDPVLVREGRTMVSTPTADALAAPVRETLTRIQSLLSSRSTFDPARDERTFTVMTSDYAAVAVLQPLLARLTTDAPRVRLLCEPMDLGFHDRLMRNQVDLMIVPRQAVPRYADYCHEMLYEDRYVVAVDAEHPDVGDELSIEQFTDLPYLATHVERVPSLAEAQLDLLGVPRRVDVLAGFGIAPFFLRGTRLVTLIPELWGRRLAGAAGLRLLEPPFALAPLSEMMLWVDRREDDPAHQWLRASLRQVASGFAGSSH